MVKTVEKPFSCEVESWTMHDEEVLAHRFNAIQKKLAIRRQDRKENWEKWVESLKHQSKCQVPKPKIIRKSRFRLSQLDKADPRGIFAGKYVGCCQHPQGFGAPCAWHGHESPNGAFWVVEANDDAVAAVAWVWRHGDALVIDSVEMSEDDAASHRKSFFHNMYRRAAQSVVGKKGITRVYAGVGRCLSWYEESYQERPFPSPARYRYKTHEGEYRNGDDSNLVHVVAQIYK